jgi:hypothetical protein
MASGSRGIWIGGIGEGWGAGDGWRGGGGDWVEVGSRAAVETAVEAGASGGW